jgi:hypothetical protein
MSINFTTPAETPREIKLANIASMIKSTADNSFRRICEVQKRGVDMVWKNPNFTPQEIIDALGQDAIKIFQYHGALTDYIVSVATTEGIAPDIKLPTNSFTVDLSAGSITVSNQPYQ